MIFIMIRIHVQQLLFNLFSFKNKNIEQNKIVHKFSNMSYTDLYISEQTKYLRLTKSPGYGILNVR